MLKEDEQQSSPSWAMEISVDESEQKEEEKSWRDPSAYKLRTNVRSWMSNEACRTLVIKVGDTSLLPDGLLD